MASWLCRTALWLPMIAPSALTACSNPGAGVVPVENQYPGYPEGQGSVSEQQPPPPGQSATDPPPPSVLDSGTSWRDASGWQKDAETPWDSGVWDSAKSTWDATADWDTSEPSPTYDAAPPPPPEGDAAAANTCATPQCGIDGFGNCGCQATANGQGYFLECQNNGQCECLTGNAGSGSSGFGDNGNGNNGFNNGNNGNNGNNNNNGNNFFFDDQACFSEQTIQQLFIQACGCP